MRTSDGGPSSLASASVVYFDGTRSGSMPCARSASAVAGPTARDAAVGERPRVERRQAIPDGIDGVRAREEHPRVAADVLQRVVERRVGRRFDDLDRRELERLGPRVAEHRRELAGLRARARDEHAHPRERTARDPVEPLAQRRDLTDDEHGRRHDPRRRDGIGHLLERRVQRRAAAATSPTRRRRPACPRACRRAAARATITSRRSIPMRKTALGARASASQSSEDDSFVGSSCPVAIATHDAWSRCVSGMPAYAGPAIADVTPGTISNAIPASASSSASSPPRPNTNGSPPLSRTTTRPLRASSTSTSLMRC